MAVLSSPPPGGGDEDPKAMARQIRALSSVVAQFQTQNNVAPGYFSPVNGKLPVGVPPGSMVARTLQGGSIALSIADANGNGQEVVIGGEAPSASNYIPPQTHTGAPTTAQFPNNGSFGWYKNTSTGNWYFTLNFSGSMVFQDLATFTGTISAGQHGNLPGGALHAAASGSAAGFLSAADKGTYDANVATVNAITSTGTPGHIVNGTILYVGGVPVITARAAAVANSTDVTNVAVQLNALLASLRAIDLLSP